MAEHKHKHDHAEGCSCGCEHEHSHSGDCSCGCGHNHEEEISKKDFGFKVGFGGALLIIGYVLSEFTEVSSFIPLICFAVSYIIIGFNILKEAIEGISHGNIFNENFLMSIASIGAFVIGEYTEGCAVVLLYTIGEYLQSVALGKSRKSIKDMLQSAPSKVCVIRDEKQIFVEPS